MLSFTGAPLFLFFDGSVLKDNATRPAIAVIMLKKISFFMIWHPPSPIRKPCEWLPGYADKYRNDRCCRTLHRQYPDQLDWDFHVTILRPTSTARIGNNHIAAHSFHSMPVVKGGYC
jgi:hypothetical protein